jgi:hypothetical protein
MFYSDVSNKQALFCGSSHLEHSIHILAFEGKQLIKIFMRVHHLHMNNKPNLTLARLFIMFRPGLVFDAPFK